MSGMWPIDLEPGDRVIATVEFELDRVDADGELIAVDRGEIGPYTGIFPEKGWKLATAPKPLPETPGSVIALRDPHTYAQLTQQGVWLSEHGTPVDGVWSDQVTVVFDAGKKTRA